MHISWQRLGFYVLSGFSSPYRLYVRAREGDREGAEEGVLWRAAMLASERGPGMGTRYRQHEVTTNDFISA